MGLSAKPIYFSCLTAILLNQDAQIIFLFFFESLPHKSFNSVGRIRMEMLESDILEAKEKQAD